MNNYIKEIEQGYLQIDTDQMIEVDRLMMKEYGIELIQMMENAGRCLAILARERFFQGDAAGKKIVILAGTGGNGGGALVCARRLSNWGADVAVFLTKAEDQLNPVPTHQLKILQRMAVPIKSGEAMRKATPADLVIDGIIGYRIKGDPYGVPAAIISWANQQSTPILSLDTPSGLDLTSGNPHQPTINATATLTLAMPKKGLFTKQAKALLGELYLGDISVPPQLYAEQTLQLPNQNIFRHSDILRVY
ncbi:MAG: NAD(P)H-hydrate epimerase [Saprospiraceae bacterium]|nr:NAD(P)H-hydrate epimerase [Saprospiraceae bacterium]